MNWKKGESSGNVTCGVIAPDGGVDGGMGVGGVYMGRANYSDAQKHHYFCSGGGWGGGGVRDGG